MNIAHIGFALICLYLLWYRWRGVSKLPPGPRGLPVIGNKYQISAQYPWKQVQEWHKVYGPIISLRIGANTIISLGNHEVARDILSKRSITYSDRPRMPFAGEHVAKGMDVAFMPYGTKWKQRNTIHLALFNARRSLLCHPIQELESRQLLFNLLSTNGFDRQFSRFSSSLIFTLLYGRRFVRGDEPELKEFEHVMKTIYQAEVLTNWWVDTFPILDYMPRSMAKWKAIGDDLYNQQTWLYESNFNKALETTSWNWCKYSLEQAYPVTREELVFALGELFGAGARSTAGSLRVAVLACVTHPDAMRRLQQELDQKIGSMRIPTCEDIPDLPYLQAFVTELHRWFPTTPAGVAHSPTKNDHYKGFTIPKGAAVSANVWGLHMDERVFPDPNTFRPDRWLDNLNLPISTFGYGKRSCPGLHFARKSMMLAIAGLLWAYDIRWKEGYERTRDQVGATHEGFHSEPLPFQVVFSVRDTTRRKVVVDGIENTAHDVETILASIGQKYSAD